MIPRYAPTYKITDLLNGLMLTSNPDIENQLCARLRSIYNAKHVFLFGSAREAIYAILKAHNRSGRVLIPAYNCIVVPEAIRFAGYTIAFVDIDSQSLNMTAESVEKAITPDVRAILLTHLFGIPCDIDEILYVLRKQDILIIEDAAPAMGAKYKGHLVGCLGDAGVISFHSTKIISAEVGGALLTNNEKLAFRVKELLKEASAPENTWMLFVKALSRKLVTNQRIYGFTHLGYRLLRGEKTYEILSPQTKNGKFLSLCSPFACALVIIQLERLKWNLERRRSVARIYQSELSRLSNLSTPIISYSCNPAWIQFPIRVEDKWAFYKYMQRNNVDVTWTYRYSCSESFGLNGYPNALETAKTVLGLPTSPNLSTDDALHISDVVKKFPTITQ